MGMVPEMIERAEKFERRVERSAKRATASV
jgi:hypothetical protein